MYSGRHSGNLVDEGLAQGTTNVLTQAITSSSKTKARDLRLSTPRIVDSPHKVEGPDLQTRI